MYTVYHRYIATMADERNSALLFNWVGSCKIYLPSGFARHSTTLRKGCRVANTKSCKTHAICLVSTAHFLSGLAKKRPSTLPTAKMVQAQKVTKAQEPRKRVPFCKGNSQSRFPLACEWRVDLPRHGQRQHRHRQGIPHTGPSPEIESASKVSPSRSCFPSNRWRFCCCCPF